MAKAFRPYLPEQDFLLPPSLRDWLPEDHLAYFVSDLVDQLNLSAITASYEAGERAYPPYHPVMMTKVLVYAYCVGVFSSRKIQRRLIENVAFRVLAAGNNFARYSSHSSGPRELDSRPPPSNPRKKERRLSSRVALRASTRFGET